MRSDNARHPAWFWPNPLRWGLGVWRTVCPALDVDLWCAGSDKPLPLKPASDRDSQLEERGNGLGSPPAADPSSRFHTRLRVAQRRKNQTKSPDLWTWFLKILSAQFCVPQLPKEQTRTSDVTDQSENWAKVIVTEHKHPGTNLFNVVLVVWVKDTTLEVGPTAFI